MVQPLVSIILVNYNGYSDTVDCIRSLLNVDYDNFTIYVIDNGSTVNATPEQLQYISQHSNYIWSDNNLGFSGGNNLGIDYAMKDNPDYYLLLNNDTEVEPDFLDKLVKVGSEKDDAGIITGKILWFDDKLRVWYAGGEYNYETGKTTHFHYDEINNESDKKIEAVTFASGCLWLIPRQVICNVGKMDERMFLYAEDTEYCCRVIKNGLKIYYTNDSVIYHKVSRSTGFGSTNSQYYNVRNTLFINNIYSSNRIRVLLRQIVIWEKEAFRGRMDFYAVQQGILDFVKHKSGKRDK